MQQNPGISKSPQENRAEELKKKLPELEKQYYEIFEEILGQKTFDPSGVLFLGYTGDGKTTLLTHIDGIPLKGQKDEFDMEGGIILVADNDPTNLQGIYGGFRSGTRKAIRHQEYWDLPGILGDTDGYFQEVVNSLWISSLCSRLEKIKIAIVISEDNLKADKYMKLCKILGDVGEMFAEIDKQISGFCLIVTKCKNPQAEKLRKILSQFLSQQRKNLSEKQSKLLQHFASNQSALAFFRRPTEEGLITDVDRREIIEAIEKLQWCETPRTSPCVGLSEKAKTLLSEFKYLELEKLRIFIEDHFDSRRILIWIEKILDDPSSNAEVLRTILENLKIKFSSLRESPIAMNKALHILQRICDDLKDHTLGKLLIEKSKPLEFIAKIDPGTCSVISNDVSGRFSFFSSVCEELSDLMKEPEIMQSGETLTLSGKIITSRNINQALFENPKISEFDVYSSVVIFLEDDITAPGVRMSLLSPQVQVKGAPSINLTGISGRSHELAKAVSGQIAQVDPPSPSIQSLGPKAKKGDDGLPGLPGHNGGSFFVKTRIFKDSENLSVDVSGGQGGPGQDGGDGANGADGKEGNSRSKVEKRDSSALVGQKPIEGRPFQRVLRTVLTFNSKFLMDYQAFEEGQIGGDAGLGGKGGCGGNPGEIEVGRVVLKKKNQNKGSDGLNGRVGSPGTGGRNGPIYQGTFVEEKIFGRMRGHREWNSVHHNLLFAGTTVDSIAFTTLQLSTLDSISSAGLSMTELFALGTLDVITVKSVLSLVSIGLFERWEVEPHKVDNSFRARNGSISGELNSQGRRESEAPRKISQEAKLANYERKFGKESLGSIEKLVQKKSPFSPFEIDQKRK